MKYWLREKNLGGGLMETHVYRESTPWNQVAKDGPFPVWKTSYLLEFELDALFSADLSADLTVGDAAQMLRKLRDEK